MAVLKIDRKCPKVMLLDPATRTTLAAFVVTGFPDSLTDLLRHNQGIDGPSATVGHVATPINFGNFLQLDAGIVDHGSSGGPIYDPVSGLVIGMVVTKDAHPESRVDYALAVNPMIIPFLRNKSIAFSVPSVNSPLTNAALTLRTAGNFSGTGFFGHRPETCSYAVDLTIRDFDVTIVDKGVRGGNLLVHMKETADPACPYTPIGENDQIFDFNTGTLSNNRLDLAFTGRSTNPARSNALFHGTFTSRDRLDGDLTFLRLDTGRPFDWTVRISVLLKGS